MRPISSFRVDIKKLLPLLALFLFLLTACTAETNFTSQERTGCENTSNTYDVFYASGECGVLIPGLNEDMVPQGICYLSSENCILFTAYSSNKGNPSAIICVDAETGVIKKQVLLKTVNGETYTGHAGGICVTENDLFISNAHMLYRISLKTFLALPEKASCAFEEALSVPVNASYCCYAEGILWVGEFEYQSDYKTDASHKIKTREGTFKAWTCGYIADESGSFSSIPLYDGCMIPDYILSTPEKIQGITSLNGSIYLSRSYGRRVSSTLMRFDGLLEKEPDTSVCYGDKEIPVWFLDKENRSSLMVAPPMTEGLCTIGERIAVLFESAANTYRTSGNASENPMDRVFLLDWHKE